MASGLIISWQIEAEEVEAVRDFLFLGSKMTADGDCSHEIRRHLLLEMKPRMAQMVKNLPAMQETWVQSLRWEDPLEECMATHSCILAWKIPMDRGAWRATARGVTKRHD